MSTLDYESRERYAKAYLRHNRRALLQEAHRRGYDAGHESDNELRWLLGHHDCGVETPERYAAVQLRVRYGPPKPTPYTIEEIRVRYAGNTPLTKRRYDAQQPSPPTVTAL